MDTNVIVYKSEAGQIALVRQYRPIFSEYSIELPGGSSELNEAPLDAAIREFHEETGILLSNATLLATVALSMGTSDEKVHIFSAHQSDVLTIGENREPSVEVIWLSTADAKDVLLSQNIVDAKTLIGLTLAI
jgi:ADP-ribose pyrophosphatase